MSEKCQCKRQDCPSCMFPEPGPVEIVPANVARLADAYERGAIILGGRRAGKTWAARIASARPVNDEKPYYRCKNNLRCRKCNGYWPDKCRCAKPESEQPS